MGAGRPGRSRSNWRRATRHAGTDKCLPQSLSFGGGAARDGNGRGVRNLHARTTVHVADRVQSVVGGTIRKETQACETQLGALALWRSGALALWRSGALALLIVSAIVPTRYPAHVEIVLKPPPASIQFAVRASMGFGAYAHHVSGCCIPAVCSRFMVYVHFSRSIQSSQWHLLGQYYFLKIPSTIGRVKRGSQFPRQPLPGLRDWLELPKFSEHTFKLRIGCVCNGENSSAIHAGVPVSDGRTRPVRPLRGGAGTRVRVLCSHGPRLGASVRWRRGPWRRWPDEL